MRVYLTLILHEEWESINGQKIKALRKCSRQEDYSFLHMEISIGIKCHHKRQFDDANNIVTELQNITDSTNGFHCFQSFTVNVPHFSSR